MLYLYRRMVLLALISLCSFSLFAQSEPLNNEGIDSSEGMTQERMAEIINYVAGDIQGPINNIQFVFNEVPMALLSDPNNNRMRIIAPIVEVDKLTDTHLQAALVSNFHLALDARYAIAQGVLYAAYIHPLKELTEQQLESAVSQVSTLRLTFGTKYTSGALTFGGDNPKEEDI